MRLDYAPPETSLQLSTTASVIKVIGGVFGFIAVLALHQLLVPSPVTADAGLTIAPIQSATVQTISNNAENTLPIQATGGQAGSHAELNVLSMINEQPAEDAEEPVSELPMTGQMPAIPSNENAASDIDENNSQTAQRGAEPTEQMPLPDVLLESDESQGAEIPGVPANNVVLNETPLPGFASNDNDTVSGLQWSAVWRPFFSLTTAQGFADYISESTGLILRVQSSPVVGHYLVEVQHRTEAQRIDADRRIVETTGYRPPGAVK